VESMWREFMTILDLWPRKCSAANRCPLRLAF
jgi:hypothetical protein